MDTDHTGEHGKAALHSMGPVCGLYLCCGCTCGPTSGLNGQVVGVTGLTSGLNGQGVECPCGHTSGLYRQVVDVRTCGPTSGLNGQVVACTYIPVIKLVALMDRLWGVTEVLLVAFYPCPVIHYSIHSHT